MEVAGSVVAVVSLGIQLVGTVKKASRFIQSIRDAPEELSNLGSTLEQLHLMLKKVTDLIEQQGRCENFPSSTDLLECAVRNCESNVTKLDRLVGRLEKKFRREGEHRAVWASLSSVVKKDDLDRYRSCINGDLTALNTAIAISAYELNVHQMSIVSTSQCPANMLATTQTFRPQVSSSSVTLSKDKQLQQMKSSLNYRHPNCKRRIYDVVRRELSVLAYSGFFGSAHVRTKTTSLCGPQQEETPISEEKTFYIRSSFLQIAVELCQQRSSSRISRSLQYYQILPDKSAIFNICRQGDLESFKVALARNEAPILAQTQGGLTPLHLACIRANVELCSLLIHLGVDPDRPNGHEVKALDVFSSNLDLCSSTSIEAVIRLLTAAQKDLTGNDIERCSRMYNGPPEGLECLLSPNVYPIELDWHHLPLGVVQRAVHNFSFDAPRWTILMRKIVRLSVDLHRIHEPHPYYHFSLPTNRKINVTLLDELLRSMDDPVEGTTVIRAWLNILAAEGHDVRRYLETEMALHADQEFFLPSCWISMDRKLFFCLADEPGVEWDWWIDPEASASLICNEFRHMSCHYPLVIDDLEWECTWPFIAPKWAIYHHWPSTPSDGKKSQQQIFELASSRAARRIERKRIKVARAEGTYRPSRMPGAWIV